MLHEDMLARLVAQDVAEGGDIVALRAMVEEASALGASRVLDRLGLGDDGAIGDLLELRELLRAWRDAKLSVWKALIGWAVRGVLALVLIGVAVKAGSLDLLK